MFALGTDPPAAILEIRKDFVTPKTSPNTQLSLSEPTIFPTMLIIY